MEILDLKGYNLPRLMDFLSTQRTCTVLYVVWTALAAQGRMLKPSFPLFPQHSPHYFH